MLTIFGSYCYFLLFPALEKVIRWMPECIIFLLNWYTEMYVIFFNFIAILNNKYKNTISRFSNCSSWLRQGGTGIQHLEGKIKHLLRLGGRPFMVSHLQNLSPGAPPQKPHPATGGHPHPSTHSLVSPSSLPSSKVI